MQKDKYISFIVIFGVFLTSSKRYGFSNIKSDYV